MLLLLGAILFSSLFSIIFKLCQKWGISCPQVIFFNYVTAILISWVPVGINLLNGSSTFTDYALEGQSITFAVIQGLLFVLGFSIMDRSVWRSGVALTTVAARASLILPVLLGWMVLSQPAPKWLPVGIVIISMALILLPNENQKHIGVKMSDKTDEQRRKLAILDLACVFLCYGVSDFFLKLSQDSVERNLAAGSSSETQLNALMGFIFLSAGALSLISCIVRGNFKGRPVTIRTIAGGAVLGIGNTLCTSCCLRALERLSTDVFYPLYNIGIVILATVAGVIVFKEKIKWLQYAGIVLAIFAIFLFFK